MKLKQVFVSSVAASLCLTLGIPTTVTAGEVTVMSYNILVGLNETNELQRQADLIEAAGADIVGLQEQGSAAAPLADVLGFHYHAFNGDIAILSRFPIASTFGDGVELDLGLGHSAFMFDVHLAAYPYQPYDIRDGSITSETQAIAAAEAARGSRIGDVLGQMAGAIAGGMPTFLVGDFNEPSHLDWTQEAADADIHAMKVAWPTSLAVVDAGMSDSYRTIHPDPVAVVGDTWTPRPGADEVNDRIDIVYYAGADVTVTDTKLIGEPGGPDVDLASDGEYPSDHRAVASIFSLPFDVFDPGKFPPGDLNLDELVDEADWALLLANQHTDLSNLSFSEAYLRGDLNGDLRNDFTDFRLFKGAFDAAHGQGAFAQMVVLLPEPSSFMFVFSLGLAAVGRRRVNPTIKANPRSENNRALCWRRG